MSDDKLKSISDLIQAGHAMAEKTSTALAKPLTLITSAEHEIAEIQLDRLRNIARERLLTIEETKQYDLLVKNVRLIREDILREQANQPLENKVENVSDADLVAALSKEATTESESE